MTRRPIQGGYTSEQGDARADGDLRDAFARWASGVCVVAARVGPGGKAHGTTVSAFLPVSLDPPLLLVSLHSDAPLLVYIEDARRFTVNLLGASQRGVAGRFADRFPVGPQPFPPEGDALLDGAPVAFVCALDTLTRAGDHTLVIGRIERVVVTSEESPLIYWDRQYRALP